jgi:hypothetical protein
VHQSSDSNGRRTTGVNLSYVEDRARRESKEKQSK